MGNVARRVLMLGTRLKAELTERDSVAGEARLDIDRLEASRCRAVAVINRVLNLGAFVQHPQLLNRQGDSLTAHTLALFRNRLEHAHLAQQAVVQHVIQRAVTVLLAHKVVIDRRSGIFRRLIVAIILGFELDNAVTAYKRAQDALRHVVNCHLHIGQHDLRAPVNFGAERLALVIVERLFLQFL